MVVSVSFSLDRLIHGTYSNNTQLYLEYVRQYLRTYEAIFWTRALSTPTPASPVYVSSHMCSGSLGNMFSCSLWFGH